MVIRRETETLMCYVLRTEARPVRMEDTTDTANCHPATHYNIYHQISTNNNRMLSITTPPIPIHHKTTAHHACPKHLFFSLGCARKLQQSALLLPFPSPARHGRPHTHAHLAHEPRQLVLSRRVAQRSQDRRQLRRIDRAALVVCTHTWE